FKKIIFLILISIVAFDANSEDLDSTQIKKSDFVRMIKQKQFIIDKLNGKQRHFEILSSNVNELGVLVKKGQEIGNSANKVYTYSTGDTLEAYFYINGEELFLSFDGQGKSTVKVIKDMPDVFLKDDAVIPETSESNTSNSFESSSYTQSSTSSSSTLPKIIRVLVVVSPQAEAESWNVNTVVSHWFSRANEAMGNNARVNVTLQPAGIIVLDNYPSTIGRVLNDHLKWARNNYEIGQLRSQQKADLVALVVAQTQAEANYCGLGYVNAAYAAGFSALRHPGCGSLTFAHELGHNLGAHHDPATLTRNGKEPSYSYGAGYVDKQNDFATVMAYNSLGSACEGCIRIPYYSSAVTTYNGHSTGVTGISENDLVIANRAATVANFEPKYTSDIPNLNDTPTYCRGRGQLSWSSISGADSYKLYASSDNNFSYPFVLYEGVNLNYSYNFPSEMYAAVSACKAGICSEVSSVIKINYYSPCL
ncbi:MAG: hypothetical protein B7X54_08875, partial [Idiomarina sp. 34-48-12]